MRTQVPGKGAFVFLLDVDFIPTPGMYKSFTSGEWVDELKDMRRDFEQNKQRRALVLPAFERIEAAPYTGDCHFEAGCDFFNGVSAPRTFPQLMKMTADRSVKIFHVSKVCALPSMLTRQGPI